MNQSTIQGIARELRELWNGKAPMEVIEAVEHRLHDTIILAAQATFPKRITKMLKDMTPQALFYEPEQERLRIVLKKWIPFDIMD